MTQSTRLTKTVVSLPESNIAVGVTRGSMRAISLLSQYLTLYVDMKFVIRV